MHPSVMVKSCTSTAACSVCGMDTDVKRPPMNAQPQTRRQDHFMQVTKPEGDVHAAGERWRGVGSGDSSTWAPLPTPSPACGTGVVLATSSYIGEGATKAAATRKPETMVSYG